MLESICFRLERDCASWTSWAISASPFGDLKQCIIFPVVVSHISLHRLFALFVCIRSTFMPLYIPLYGSLSFVAVIRCCKMHTRHTTTTIDSIHKKAKFLSQKRCHLMQKEKNHFISSQNTLESGRKTCCMLNFALKTIIKSTRFRTSILIPTPTHMQRESKSDNHFWHQLPQNSINYARTHSHTLQL